MDGGFGGAFWVTVDSPVGDAGIAAFGFVEVGEILDAGEDERGFLVDEELINTGGDLVQKLFD